MRQPSLLATGSLVSFRLWHLLAVFGCSFAILTSERVSQPTFDIKELGRVGFAGDFSGISLYEYTGQAQTSPYSNGSQSILTQLPNGLFTSHGITDNSINAMCLFETSDGVKRIVIGGNFTSLKNIEAKGIALYNIDNDEVTAMKDFAGKVFTLLCDKETNSVYVGGAFSYGKSENAIFWRDETWNELPFEGFNDPVRTITSSNNNSVIFGGMFSSLQKISSPRIKNAQTINLVSTEINALQTIDNPQFSDPSAITCTNNTQKQWLVQDASKDGSWNAKFQFELWPTKLRLINADYEGRGTKIFRFTAVSLNAIMNLTYVDPKTATKKYCDAWCPLEPGSQPQDFNFVNVIGMRDFRLDVLEFYGAGGGLSSVQLFQDDIFSYAIPSINEPLCATETMRSASTVKGDWEQKNITGADSYLSITHNQGGDFGEIEFVPHVQQSGTYEVLLYTPGCIQDGSCAQRGKIEVSGIVTKDGNSFTNKLIAQTNNFDKYDTIYDGYVDAADGSFKPRIVLKPAKNQSQQTVNIVAQKVKFKLKSSFDDGQENENTDQNSSSSLNGLYEYGLSDQNTTSPASSKITSAASDLNDRADITSIIVKDGITYVAGNFTDKADKAHHFFMLDKEGNFKAVPEGGLGGSVNVMLNVGDLIYVGGFFSETKDKTTAGLAHVCAFDTKTNTWVSLGAGVNGEVLDLVHISIKTSAKEFEGIAISGNFNKILPETNIVLSIDTPGFAVWIPSQNRWMSSLDSTITISGTLSESVKSGDMILYSGSIASNTISSSGVVYMTADSQGEVGLLSSKFQFAEGQNLPSQRKRNVAQLRIDRVVVGLFVTDPKNLTILGGNFVAGSEGSIRNLAFIDGDSGDITGATIDDFTSGSTIMALKAVGNQLFVGGTLEGSNNIGGLAIWDFNTMRLSDDQPPSLSWSQNSSMPAIVYSITLRPGSGDIYVAGDFDSAGALSCGGLCIYKTSEKQWEVASSDSAGKIFVSYWKGGDSLYVGGNMVLNGTNTYMALFDVASSTYRSIPGAEIIPGPVTALTMGSKDQETVFITGSRRDGSPFLMHYKDSKFIALGDNFERTSKIKSLQVLNLAVSHEQTATLDKSNILLVTGLLRLVGFGNASAVTYDGTNWKPLLLATRQDGQPGSISAFFSEFEMNFSGEKSPMAKGFVILISLAIALALVFVIVVLGVSASYIRRRREGYVPAPTLAGTEKLVAMQDRLPPQDLFTHQTIGPGSGRNNGPPMI